MDKYQRKYLARWEAKKAKDQEKIERELRKHYEVDAREKIEKFGQSYEPELTTVSEGIIKEAHELLEELNAPPQDPRFMMSPVRLFRAQMMLMEEFGIDWRPLMISDRMWYRSPHGWFYEYNEHKLERRLDVEKTIAGIREHKDRHARNQLLRGVVRSLNRTNIIRDELMAAAHKSRTIHNCRAVKEELMMAAWHPRRIEHILNTYGWEGLDGIL